MKRYLFIIAMAFMSVVSMEAKVWTLQNNVIQLDFDDQRASFNVTDLRIGKMWEQSAADGFTVQKVKNDKGVLNVLLKGQSAFQLMLSLRDDAVDVRITAKKGAPLDTLYYPMPFLTKSASDYLLLTDGEGMLLPANDTTYPFGDGITFFCGGGLSMPWMGMVDKNVQAGYMVILDTPFDAGIRPYRQQQDQLVSFKPYWLASKGTLAYERRLTYHFFNKGGYVAQCKTYRQYIYQKNHIPTLREKEQTMPVISKMVGAPQVFVWDTGREVSVVKEMKALGIDKAFILWNSNHANYPVAGYADSLKALGYPFGDYELFTDLKKRDTIKTTLPYDIRYAHDHYPGLFKQLVALKKDGSYYSNQFGIYACPATMPEIIRQKLTVKMREYPSDAIFFDVYTANGLYECYSKDHPVTREGYAQHILKSVHLAKDDFHQVIGSEWGADYANADLTFMQGMMTLQRPLWHFGEVSKAGTIYFQGRWGGVNPPVMTGSYTASPTYYDFCINEATRLPLYELVYHDAIMTTWRWEDCNHHMPEIWWKKDLFNMLYGNYPIWCMDKARWNAFKNTFVESYKQVSPWLQQIGYEEMTNHRFITSDGKIQRSDFSSGKSIIVNFSEQDYTYEGKVVKKRSYLIL